MREFSNNTPPPKEDPDDVDINEEDAVEIIEIEDGDGLPEEIEDLGLDEEIDEFADDGINEMEEFVEVTDDAICSFKEHSGSVFCIDINPADPSMAVSGGEDDKAFLWKVQNGEVIKELTGHKDSVNCAEFSHNGKYVATVDMAGLVQVWTTADATLSWHFECSDVEWMHWHTAALVLVAGTTDGDIYMWKIPSGDCKILSGSGQKCTAGCILQNGKQVFAGYADGSLALWDLKNANPIFTLKNEQGHSDAVTCVTGSSNSALLVSGSNDSTLKIINASNGKIVAMYEAGFPQGEEDSDNSSIECVCFSRDMSYVLSGSLSGVLAIWDISAQRLRHQCKHPVGSGITALAITPEKQSLVFTAALDGIVRVWDMRSGECLQQWGGHTDTILDLKISKSGDTIVTSSDDGTARVFKG